MRRLLSIATLTFLLSTLLVVLVVPSFATEGDDHADETEMTEETSHAEDADDAEHAEDGEHAEDDGDHAEDKDDHADEDEESQWLGLQAALGVGVAFGALVFGMSGTAGLSEDHH